jgi:hypothetical protein
LSKKRILRYSYPEREQVVWGVKFMHMKTGRVFGKERKVMFFVHNET